LIGSIGSALASAVLAQAYERADHERDEANAARERADLARTDADLARADAEAGYRAAAADFELAFQSFDELINATQRKIENQPGLLPVKRQLLESAAAGLERLTQPPGEISRIHRLVVNAHQRLGDVYFDLGRTAEARKSYANDLAAAEAWAAQQPGLSDAWRAVAGAHDKIGNLADFAHDAGTAADHFRAAVGIRRKLADEYPNDRRIQREWSISLDKLGDIALAAGESAEARANYERSLAIVEALPPGADAAERGIDLRFRHSRICDACVALDDLEAADRHARRAVSEAESLTRIDAVVGRQQVAASLQRNAEVALRRGDLGAGVAIRRKILAARREILAADSHNQEAKRNVYVALSLLGQALLAAREEAAARRALEECRTLSEAAVAADPTSIQKGMDVIVVYRDLSLLDAIDGQYAAAAGWMEKCAQACRLAELEPQAAYLQPRAWRLLYERNRAILLAAARLGIDDSARFASEEPPIRIGLLRLRIKLLAWKGKFAEAAADVEELKKLAPDDRECLMAIAEALALAAAGEAERERYSAAAIGALTELLHRHPELRGGLVGNSAFAALLSHPECRKLLHPPKQSN
ncbi:MAG TPA: hypothetical protein VGL71_04770, partial [Urbifossiella sp.]